MIINLADQIAMLSHDHSIPHTNVAPLVIIRQSATKKQVFYFTYDTEELYEATMLTSETVTLVQALFPSARFVLHAAAVVLSTADLVVFELMESDEETR